MSSVQYYKALDLPHYWQAIILSINGMPRIVKTNDMPALFRRFSSSLDQTTVDKAKEKFGNKEGFIIRYDRPFTDGMTNGNAVLQKTVQRLFESTPSQIVSNFSDYIDIIKFMPFIEGFTLLRLLVQQVFDDEHNDTASKTSLINIFTIALRENNQDSYIGQLSWFYRNLIVNQTIAIRQNSLG